MATTVRHGETFDSFGKQQLSNGGMHHASKLCSQFERSRILGIFYDKNSNAAKLTALIIARPHQLTPQPVDRDAQERLTSDYIVVLPP